MAISDVNERKWIWLLCCLAAAHVFVFSAAFPFFNNVDEQAHLDLVIDYSHARIPSGLQPISPEASSYIALYSSSAYLGSPTNYPDGKFPEPLWKQPLADVQSTLLARESLWRGVTNYEVSQPPLYYAIAGGWWHLGRTLGCHDGSLLYWIRFLNIVFTSALVWIGFFAARLVFPDNPFIRLGVPAMVAFFPQTAFYSIQNDVMSPLCFGCAFICLVLLWRAPTVSYRLAMITGLAVAATLFAKIGNLPLVGVSALVVLFKTAQLARAGALRAALPALITLSLCAALPILAWFARCKHCFGDITGSASKIAFLGWTHKPISDWWAHPIFTLPGARTFLSGLIATFWQGEFMWHRQPMSLPGINLTYVVISLLLFGAGSAFLFQKKRNGKSPSLHSLWIGFWSIVTSVLFLGWLSIIFDFHDCFYPSQAHPYFTSGRLMLGVLIPFLLLLLFGLDRALGFTRSPWPRVAALGVLVVFMVVSELVTDWPIFSSEYNWFHM